ncbi:MAG: efflux RND transporter periplasmic adaptor subunit [Legionella sp.]|jgi:RND family efflux transporter MFP subunit
MLKNLKSELLKEKHRYWLIPAALFFLLLFLMILVRVQAAVALRNRTEDYAITRVAVLVAKAETGEDKIVLPGNVQAWHESPIYARTNGYLKKWYVDIGSHVKQGDLLAVIETPELDAQARQAKADLNTAIANNTIAQSTAKRWMNLVKTESVSKQDRDEKVSAAQAAAATVIAAKANLDRLEELVGFERVLAPFDGVITLRATDIGDLIDAGSSTSTSPLFRMAQTNPLRVYVQIPQYYSDRIKANMNVSLHFAELPKKEFPAKLLETAQAIDPNTRTLLAQFVVENKKGELFAGAYTQMWFTLPIPAQTVVLPVNTLLFRAQGLQVAKVNKDNKIELVSVSLSRDFGSTVEIATGVTPGDKIVVNPPDAISNGETVRVVS